ncbi:MAG: TolB family protein [Fulvivirga sp.]
MKLKFIASIFLTLAIPTVTIQFALAQTRVLDNNPSSLKWSQINTPGFRIIFPRGFDEEAQRVANTLEHISLPVSKTLGNKQPKKLSIVLQNQNSISNGFVTLGPRRSEFFTTAPQNYNFIGTNEWMDLLAIHEYRHVVQFSQSRTGWNKLFYYLFGQNTQAGMAFTAAPPWFWEGDATLTETLLTSSGRGRIPDFDRVFRANLLEGKRYDYNKQHLRSFKDFVPDHYVLGYHMVTHIRRRTNKAEIMDEITNDAWRWPFVPFTFSNSVKRHTGQYLVPTYNNMMDELEGIWNNQLNSIEPTTFERVNSRGNNIFTDYSFPQILEDGSVVAMKSGIADIEQLVKFNPDGSHSKEFIPGIINDAGMLSSTQYKVVWNEFHFDPRWRAKTYSVIKWYDFASGERRTITNKSRYAGAAISPDGYNIATVRNLEQNQYNLVILDAYTGREKKVFENRDNAQLGMPRFSEDGRSVVILKTTDAGKAIVKYDIESSGETQLTEYGDENVGHPVLRGNLLFYNSPKSGIDNIYVKDLTDGVVYQITTSKYGAYNPVLSKDGKTMYYNDHTVNGLDVVKITMDESSWKPLDELEAKSEAYYEPLIEQEQNEDLLQSVPNKKYEVKNFSKLKHMINIHSWGPFASTDLVRAEVGIFSRDLLSNTNLSLGYVYDVEEESGFASAALSYQAWYPIIDFEYQIGTRSTNSYKWDESTFLTGLRLPFVLTNSKYFTQLEISNNIGIRKVTDFESNSRATGRDRFFEDVLVEVNGSDSTFVDLFDVEVDEVDNGDLIFNDFEISFTNVMKQSPRDINSKWGQFLVFNRLSTISGDFEGATTGIRGGLFFPGLVNNHSFFLRGGYQSKNTDPVVNNYSFRNVIFKPRGYSYPDEETFASLQANYALPLLYPDLSLGPVLNIKRVKANLFADIGRENFVRNFFLAEAIGSSPVGTFFGSTTLTNNYFSYGVELTFDINVMRFVPNIEIGARIVNIRANDFNTSGGTSVEIIFGGINF